MLPAAHDAKRSTLSALWLESERIVLRLRQILGFRTKRQAVLGPYVADFVVPSVSLVIEVDGSAHDGRGLADAHRTANLALLGYSVIRVTASAVMESPVAVACVIAAEVARLRASVVR